MTSSDPLRTCRVCGYYFNEWCPWGEDGRSPSFDTCPCCGVEFGYGDSSLVGVRRWREHWIAKGAPWSDGRTPSDGLDVDDRLKRVAAQFR
ncbi:hypothetical protein SAMN04489812_4027 [Microlunatus soli]|uniref:Rubredoxin-like domain-containing protein n=1 Tax=Microlunatus soli TaxID=630515 RepID=A0A1H1XCI5_9ACTN|nr:hypothetical protein SAMN04489812_4027 [Microlunatus soli]